MKLIYLVSIFNHPFSKFHRRRSITKLERANVEEEANYFGRREIKRERQMSEKLACNKSNWRERRKKRRNAFWPIYAPRRNYLHKRKKARRRPRYLWTERTLDNTRCRVANNREHVSTRLSCTDIIIDSVTEGTVLNVMPRFQSVTSRASSFAEKEKGYIPCLSDP